jgi:hypothetical protein
MESTCHILARRSLLVAKHSISTRLIVLESVWASEASSRDAWQLDFDVLTSPKDPTLASRAVPPARISHGGGHVASRRHALRSRSLYSEA